MFTLFSIQQNTRLKKIFMDACSNFCMHTAKRMKYLFDVLQIICTSTPQINLCKSKCKLPDKITKINRICIAKNHTDVSTQNLFVIGYKIIESALLSNFTSLSLLKTYFINCGEMIYFVQSQINQFSQIKCWCCEETFTQDIRPEGSASVP